MGTTSIYRALVVDDEPAVRQATMRALSRVGFRCEAACCGLDAFELAQQTCYDLVLADLRMPDGNGHQLAVELLELQLRPAILIITGVAEPRLSDDLRRRGVDGVFLKPVDYEQLAQSAVAAVERRRVTIARELAKSKAMQNRQCSLHPDGQMTVSHTCSHDTVSCGSAKIAGGEDLGSLPATGPAHEKKIAWSKRDPDSGASADSDGPQNSTTQPTGQRKTSQVSKTSNTGKSSSNMPSPWPADPLPIQVFFGSIMILLIGIAIGSLLF
jgi:CheY-like chemotaxis protein